MLNKMLIDAAHPEETRVVAVRGQRVEEFDFESANRKPLRGNIYLAKVTRVEPSLQAAFIEYGGNRHGFLAFAEIHPDYYQIPMADRQALLAEDARFERDAEREEERASSRSRAKPAAGGDEDAETGDADGDDDVIEQMGAGDAHEELPERPRQTRRQYKIQEVIRRRQILLVQVVKEERGNKGAALTTYLSLAGRYSVLMPNTARGGGISRKITQAADRKRLKTIAQELEVPEGMGVILRTAGAARTKAEVKRDFEYLLRLWENVRELTLKSSAPFLVYEEGSLIKRAIRDLYNKDTDEVLVAGEEGYREAKDFMRMLTPSHAKQVKLYKEPEPIFAKFGVETQLDALFSNVVTMKSGGYIVINQTEALVAIDVNSGRSTREHNIEDTALKTNLEASDEIARQLRLRDLAGLIVIDFIDMDEKRNNRSVEKRLKDALKNDRARIQVGRISPFGLMEMSRQRIRTGVVESSMAPCPHCSGMGYVRATPSVALHVLRQVEDSLQKNSGFNIAVRTRTEVALYILNQKRSHLRAIEDLFGVMVTVQADDAHTGVNHLTLERGEPVAPRPEGSLPRVEDSRVIAVEEPDDEDVTEDTDEEEVEAPRNGDAAAGANGAVDGDSERKRRRRRRRRRRGGEGRDGEPREANGQQPYETRDSGNGAQADVSDADDDDADAGDAVSDAGSSRVSDADGVQGSDAQADGPQGERTTFGRRRRRGRRSGGRDGDRPDTARAPVLDPAYSEQPIIDDAFIPAAAPEPAPVMRNKPSAAVKATDATENATETDISAPAKPVRARRTRAKAGATTDAATDPIESKADTPASADATATVEGLPTEEVAKPPVRRRSRVAKAVSSEDTPVAVDQSAQTGSAAAAAAEPAPAAEIAAETPRAEPKLAEPARAAEPPVPDVASTYDPEKAKRGGWWSRAKTALGG